MASGSIAFDILAKDHASKTFDKVAKAAKGAAKDTDAFDRTMGGISKSVAVAGVAVAAFVGFGLKSLARIEKIGAQTDAVLKSTGGSANVSRGHIDKLAGSLESLTSVEAETITSGQNLLLTFTNIRNEAGKGNDVFDQSTKIMTDMSVALGQDMKSSAIQLGKALNDPVKGVTALTRVGVSFTAQQKEQIKALAESGDLMGAQKVILAELTKEFGGSAEALGNTTAGKIERFKHALGTMQEEIAANALPALTSLTNWAVNDGIPKLENFGRTVSEMVTIFSELPGPVQVGVGALAGIVATAPIAVGAWKKITSAVDAVTVAYQGMGKAGRGATLALGGVGLALAAGATILGIFASRQAEAKQAAEDFSKTLDEQTGAVTRDSRAWILNELRVRGIADALREAKIPIDEVVDSIASQDGSIGDLAQRMRDWEEQAGSNANVWENLKGGVNRATEALGLNDTGVFESERGLRDLAEQVSKSPELWKEFTAAVDGGAGAQDGFQQELGAANAKIDEQVSALEKLIDAENEAAGVTLGARDAQRRYQEAVDAAREALKDNGKTLDRTTEKGRKNEAALDAMAKAALDQAQAMADNGASQDTTRRKIQKAREEFIRTARQMGLSQEAAQKLANKLGLIPGKYEAEIHADTRPASAKLDAFLKKYSGRQIQFQADMSAWLKNNAGVLPAAAGGRKMPGAPSDRDNMFAHVASGEWIVNARSSQKYDALLAAINADRLPGFAKGGPVTLKAVASTDRASDQFEAGLRKTLGSLASSGGVSGVPSSVSGNAALVKSLFASMFGWGNHWPATYRLLMKESGFRNTAQNPTSTAYGMFQFLDSTWAGTGIGKTSDPRLQTIAGGRYIDGRYGNPTNALNFHLGHNWYDKGGWLMPGATVAYNGTGKPERVLGPSEKIPSADDYAKALVRALRANGMTLVAIDSGKRADLLSRGG